MCISCVWLCVRVYVYTLYRLHILYRRQINYKWCSSHVKLKYNSSLYCIGFVWFSFLSHLFLLSRSCNFVHFDLVFIIFFSCCCSLHLTHSLAYCFLASLRLVQRTSFFVSLFNHVDFQYTYPGFIIVKTLLLSSQLWSLLPFVCVDVVIFVILFGSRIFHTHIQCLATFFFFWIMNGFSVVI